MRVAMIGTGYVGLVSGACFSEFGHEVICVDKDASKIEALEKGVIPIFEPGLDDVVKNNVEAGRLSFTTDLASAVKGVDAVFIGVGTPSRRGDGRADLSYVYAAAKEIAENIDGYTVIVTKSTVPVGTGREVYKIVSENLADGASFDIASNPEFLREGSAIEDFMRPDRVVVGVESEEAKKVMSGLYRPLYLRDFPVVFTGIETAELIKYASNCFLATKITFINEMADLCEVFGADVKEVSKAMGLDGRIGSKFLHAGPGYGGSCFPKDTRALGALAAEAGSPVRIVDLVNQINDERKIAMADKIIKACGGSVEGKTIAVLGLTFKPNTDDMRESPALDIIPALVKAGAKIQAFDPEGMEEAKKHAQLADITYCEGAYETMEGADALTIVTEWNEFRALDFDRVKSLLSAPIFIDLRNIYSPVEMAELGFDFTCVGRKKLAPQG